jgi:hypothetical protein
MKPLARRKPLLSLVRPVPKSAQLTEQRTEVTPSTLKEFFTGWLEAVSTSQGITDWPQDRHRPVSRNDLIRLNRATVRESTTLRQWPPEAVQKFLTAEVIKRK